MTQLDSFRAARWLRTFNLVLQAVLFLTLFGGLNYLALNHHWRYDLTKNREYTLSPETRAYLEMLNRPVRIVVTTTDDFDYPDIRGLLREYVYQTERNANGRITVDYIDVYKNRRDADQLGLDQPNVILLLCGDRQRALGINDLYQMEKQERKSFRGEQELTAAILDVSNPTRKKIYFLRGHSELQPDNVTPKGLSVLTEQLRVRNFDLDALDITTARRVPDDAALVIAPAPRSVDAFVQEQLRQYLTNRAGRMILLLDPGLNHGLDKLLEDWGVLDDNTLVWDTDPNSMTEEGELLVRAFVPHPITQALLDSGVYLRLGLARSIRADPGRSRGAGLNVETVAASSTTAWGERSLRSGRIPEYDPMIDLKGLPIMEPKNRLGLVVASERVGARENLDFSVPRGRLVVFGTSDLVTNQRIANIGNLTIFLSAINWTVDRDTQLKTAPRPIEKFQLSLSGEELLKLRYSLLFVLPAVTAILGLIVYWTRRA